MADLSQIKEHMEIVGADGVHLGTIDHVDGDLIKLVKADSGFIIAISPAGLLRRSRSTSCACLLMPRTLLCWRKDRTARR